MRYALAIMCADAECQVTGLYIAPNEAEAVRQAVSAFVAHYSIDNDVYSYMMPDPAQWAEEWIRQTCTEAARGLRIAWTELLAELQHVTTLHEFTDLNQKGMDLINEYKGRIGLAHWVDTLEIYVERIDDHTAIRAAAREMLNSDAAIRAAATELLGALAMEPPSKQTPEVTAAGNALAALLK
jgi:hypothetical protein